MNIGQALLQARGQLPKGDTVENNLSCELLLRRSLNLSRAEFYTRIDRKITASQATVFQSLMRRFCAGEPVAYILKEREFYGHQFIVLPGVLIPRPETELLVERACDMAATGRYAIIADIGTGSGAVAVSIARQVTSVRIRATDISKIALEIAAQNCQRQGVTDRISLFQGDLLEALPEPVDMIVANLPYVKTGDLGTSLRFEPELALDGGLDGLDIIKRLISQLNGKLRRPGAILLETGCDQASYVAVSLADNLPGMQTGISRDLNGIERVVSGCWS